MPTSLIIHGHFYQPPRENPWTEAVDPEPSAAPYHDWNERIYRECYRANENARILRSDGVVEAIVSNYHYLSFNLGPTLLSWMQSCHPHGYARILQADRESCDLHGGHGNAIAQAYNHAILPLCNPRDQVTQIRWGLADFRHRYGREAESMWLAETAVNHEVLDRLVEHGLKYLILAPRQCQRVRPLAGGEAAEWRDVGDGSVDPGLAYRYEHRDGSGRGMALFFYDGPIAQAIAFENALADSQRFIGLFKRAQGGPGRVVHVATDGESYGHHSQWGDRVLAYALRREATAQGFEVTNYAAYLAAHPPQWQADIKAGPDGEGTAWSCAHGVGRWIRDCGCHTGGQEDWNQAWRGPLRAALDLVRDGLAGEFERAAHGLLKDPWAARDAFVQVVLDPSPAAKAAFFAEQAARALDPDEQVRALSLLDMQRQCLLMYTSCGWFFNELSGIETVQILRYAARALDYAVELGLRSPREAFLNRLREAHSNVPEHGHGADIYHKLVEPARVSVERLSAHLGLTALAEGALEGQVGGWDCGLEAFKRLRLGALALASGHVTVRQRITGRSYEAGFVALHFGGMDFLCSVKSWAGAEVHQAEVERVEAAFTRGLVPGILTALRTEFGGLEVGLDHVLPDGRERVSRAVFGDLLRKVSEQTSRIYEENRHRLDLFQAAGFPLPSELRAAAEYTLSRQLQAEIAAQRESRDPRAYEKAINLAHEAAALGYRLDTGESQKLFSDMVTDAVRRAVERTDAEGLKAAVGLLQLTRDLGIRVSLETAQEIACRAKELNHPPDQLVELAGLLWLDPALLLRPANRPMEP
jgi:alpha-amylase/alpha-mannosidase (GH57 family)